MSKKIATSLALALLLALAAEAIPSSFVDPVEGASGWISTGLRWFLPINGKGLRVGFEFYGCGPDRIGFGLELGGNGLGKGIMFAVSGLYFYDPFPAENFTVPLKLRLGGIGMMKGEASPFASLSAGALLFAPRLRYNANDGSGPSETCFTAGVDGELYYVKGRIYPDASFSDDLAIRLGPNQPTYYYYY
ncbi:MAG: hypothetical protein ABSF43_14770 [Rectinemataceae bacterium]|jgi:hypothetical protein